MPNNYLISGREYDGSGNIMTSAQPRGCFAQSYQGQIPVDVSGIDGCGKGKYGKSFKGKNSKCNFGKGKDSKGFGKGKGKSGKDFKGKYTGKDSKGYGKKGDG